MIDERARPILRARIRFDRNAPHHNPSARSRRRAEAQGLRAQGVPVHEIARVLTISVREVYRLRQGATACVARLVRSAASTVAQGSARPIRLQGAQDAVQGVPECAETNGNDPVIDDDFAPEFPPCTEQRLSQSSPSTESPRVARSPRVIRRAMQGALGETSACELSIAYIQRRTSEILAKLCESERPP